MAANANLMGMDDFGLSKSSAASGVDSGVPDLAQLMGDAVTSEVMKSDLLEQQIAQVRSAETPGLLERLLSPRGLALAGGTAAAGALGGSGAALGFGLGAVKGTDALVEADRAQKKKAIEELTAENEKVQDRLEKTRNRLSTIFNTNPDAFVDPSTGQPVVSARELGWYMTGVPIPIHPQTRRMMEDRETRWQKRHDVLSKAYEDAPDVASKRSLAQLTLANLDWPDPPAEVLDALSQANGPEFESAFAATLFRHGGQTGIDAMIFASEEGLPLYDAEVLRRVKFQTDPASGSGILDLRFIQLMDEVNAWEAHPANAQAVLQIKGAAATPEDERRQIATRALEGRTGDIEHYMNRNNVPPTIDLAMFQQSWGINKDKFNLASKLRGVQNLQEFLGMDDETYQRFQYDQAVRSVDESNQAVGETQSRQVAVLRNQVAATLHDSLPTLGLHAIYNYVDQISSDALRNAKRGPDGMVDRADYERLIHENTQEAIEQLSGNAKE